MNIIGWADEEDESSDSERTSKIEKEGRRMLISIVSSTKKGNHQKNCREGDPSSKIVELAEKLDVDLIMMGILE